MAKQVTSYRHQEKSSQVPDTAPGPYYVSVRDGERFAFVSGPYATHAEALGLVDRARELVEQHHPQAIWHKFGTVRCRETCNLPGRLQQWGYDLALETKKCELQLI